MYLIVLGIVFVVPFVVVSCVIAIGAGIDRKVPRRFLFGISTVVALLTTIGFVLRFPPDAHVNCHVALECSLDQWFMENKTNAYPNVRGEGRASFALINVYCHYEDPSLYGYVPGLRHDDPKELVMIYLKRMTRRTWNGDYSATIFTKKKWFIGGPEYGCWPLDTDRRLPEGGQLVDTPEFKRRLATTLEFLKQNNRPYWETVANEHEAFLKSIKE